MIATAPLTPTALDLGDNLRLRFATPDDATAVTDFNTRVFDHRVTHWTKDLISGNHPTVQAGDFTLIEDTRHKRIVSSMAMISQTWSYAGIPFSVSRAELVATDPAYRRRGLVRRQFEQLHARGVAREEMMQVITGVDWFYRQFGYEMGVKVWGSRCVDAGQLHRLNAPKAASCRLRPIVPADQAFIRQVYGESIREQLFAAHRSGLEWDYEFDGRSDDNTRRREWLVIESPNGESIGYVQYLPCLASPSWPMVRIYQVELKPGVGYLNLWRDLLHGLWAHAQGMHAAGRLPCPELLGLELALERDHPLFHALSKDWLREIRPSPWYIRVPNPAAFVRRVRPALEKHLVGTVAEGYTGELKLNFCRSGLRLELVRGKITTIQDWLPEDVSVGNARFPETTFVQLLCGWRRTHELLENFPDCKAEHEAALLLDALFPPFHGKVWVMA